jgi:hypothetical protein
MDPVIVCFGRYLSTRIDLLPWEECRRLAQLPDTAAPMPPQAIHELFGSEIGVSPEQAFLEFDPRPVESRMFWQSHAARLAGATVVVRIRRPEVDTWTRNAKEVLLLEEAFADLGLDARRFRSAVADFEAEWRQCTDPDSDLTAFDQLRRSGNTPDAAGVPTLYRHLCTRHVLVYETFEPIANVPPPSPEYARTLAAAWLRQALDTEIFPVEPRTEKVGLSADGRILWVDGPFANLAEGIRDSLRAYLAAIAAQDLSQGYEHFAALIKTGYSAAEGAEMRRRFLQTVAFRDGFRAQRAIPQFAEEVLIHWKIMSQIASPCEGMTTFYRGLVELIRTTSEMAPGRDSLVEALYDLRVRTLFGQALDVFQPTEFAGLMERYVAGFMRSPGSLDRLLTGLSGGNISGPPTERAGRNGQSRAGLLLIAMAAVILLLFKVTAFANSRAMDSLAALILVGFGAVILRIGTRGD